MATASFHTCGASPTFSALNAWFTRYQTLTDTWSLKISGAGQVASGPLYLSQQFYLGGAAFGRGYGAADTAATTAWPVRSSYASTRS